MAIASALQSVVLLQVISRTVCQFPAPFQYPGAPPMMPNMQPMPGHSFMPSAPGHMPYPMQQKMPMVVMPYYNKNSKAQKRPKRKHRPKKRHYETSCSEEDSESVSDEFDYRVKPKAKRRQVLTPVVSYVTKDGYVVYQKKVKKDKAKDWLEMGHIHDADTDDEADNEHLGKKINKISRSKKHYHSKH